MKRDRSHTDLSSPQGVAKRNYQHEGGQNRPLRAIINGVRPTRLDISQTTDVVASPPVILTRTPKVSSIPRSFPPRLPTEAPNQDQVPSSNPRPNIFNLDLAEQALHPEFLSATSTFYETTNQHLHLLEMDHRILPEDLSQYVTLAYGRGRLINMIRKVHTQYHFHPHSLYLAINIIDRYLSIPDHQHLESTLTNIKMVGLAALLLATKLEENRLTFYFRNFVKSCYAMKVQEFEYQILFALNFFVAGPTMSTFLSRYLPHFVRDQTMIKCLFFVAERVMSEVFLLKFLPSQIAATILRLIRRSFHNEPWTQELTQFSMYSEIDLEECEAMIKVSLKNSVIDSELLKKYDSSPNVTSHQLIFSS